MTGGGGAGRAPGEGGRQATREFDPRRRSTTAVRVAANTAWMTAAALGGRVVSYGTFVLLARVFSETEVGAWAVILTALLLAEVIANLGLDKILVRDAARAPADRDRLTATILSFKLLAAAVTALAAYCCLRFGYPEIARTWPWATALALLAVPVIAATRTIEAWHTARENLRLPAVGQLLERLTLVLVLAAVWRSGAGFGWFVAASALAPAVRLLVVLIPARPHLRLAAPRGLRPLLGESFLLFGVEVMVGVYLRLDLIFVSKMDSLAAAGLYNAAYRIFECFTVIFSGYLAAVFPVLARKTGAPPRHGTMILGLAVVTAAAGLGILCRRPILLLFGPDYLAAAPALAMLLIALPLSYATSFLANSLVATGRSRKLLILAPAVVLVNAAANFLLIPRLSITGAGLAFVLSETASILILLAITRRRRAPEDGTPHA
ncbi:MAG: oligosaccharide flippase family protein [Planctomycetes bacterium]|nr:oligosaccharide flippase family protein [Planctomycetota bacterium]